MSEWKLQLVKVGPWLSMNDRPHWAERARGTRAWRAAALWSARAARLPVGLDLVRVEIWVHKTTARKYDAGNLQPTAKAVVDGLVDYGLVPDDDNEHLIGPDMRMGAKAERPGLTVIIRAEEMGL